MHLRSKPLRATLILFCLAVAGVASAGPLQDDLKARRARVSERLGPDTVAVFWSAPARVFSTDVNYEFRQESNLLYLTGIDQEDTVLVLIPGSETKEYLFVREADQRREHWNGHSLTPAEAGTESGISSVMTANQFEPFITSVFSRRSTAATAEFAPFFKALGDNRAKLAVLAEFPPDLSAPPSRGAEFAAQLRAHFFGFS